jgi:hypothetical protein
MELIGCLHKNVHIKIKKLKIDQIEQKKPRAKNILLYKKKRNINAMLEKH